MNRLFQQSTTAALGILAVRGRQTPQPAAAGSNSNAGTVPAQLGPGWGGMAGALASSSPSGKLTWYVDPVAGVDDTDPNRGRLAQPFRTLRAAFAARAPVPTSAADFEGVRTFVVVGNGSINEGPGPIVIPTRRIHIRFAGSCEWLTPLTFDLDDGQRFLSSALAELRIEGGSAVPSVLPNVSPLNPVGGVLFGRLGSTAVLVDGDNAISARLVLAGLYLNGDVIEKEFSLPRACWLNARNCQFVSGRIGNSTALSEGEWSLEEGRALLVGSSVVKLRALALLTDSQVISNPFRVATAFLGGQGVRNTLFAAPATIESPGGAGSFPVDGVTNFYIKTNAIAITAGAKAIAEDDTP